MTSEIKVLESTQILKEIRELKEKLLVLKKLLKKKSSLA